MRALACCRPGVSGTHALRQSHRNCAGCCHTLQVPWQPASLRSVLGGSLGPGVDRTALERLIELAVTESDELDFKAGFYEFGHADAEERRKLRVEAAKDVAAFANHRGGVVLMGVKEERGQGTAAELAPLQVSDGQWRSLTQAVADVVSPPVAFERVFIPTEDDGSGVAALIVPPSPRRPHALVDRNTIRYPALRISAGFDRGE